jgi:putative transposase
MNRKQKGSKNHHKTKRRVQKIHTSIANARLDFLHKATTAICNNHTMVVVEDLNVKQMSKSATGTNDAHRKHVKAKSGLNKSILDQGWGEFRRQLAYKLAWRGVHRRAATPHQPNLPGLWSHRQRKPSQPSAIQVRQLRLWWGRSIY